jgi:sugar phosphate isomerase/epimerase
MLGFDFVDLGVFEHSDGLKPGQLIARPRKFARQLKRDLIHAGLRVSDVSLQTGLNVKDSSDNVSSAIVRSRNRKTFLLALELCTELECPHLTGLPGGSFKDVDEKESFELAIEEVGWRHHIASGTGIRYAMKPHIDSVCASVASVHSFLDAIPGLTLTLDYAHFVAQKIGARDVHALLPFASHLQARGAARRRLQVPVEKNQVDFAGMVKRLYDHKYRGFVAIAYLRDSWWGCDRTDNMSETLLLRNQMVEYLRPQQRENAAPQGRQSYPPSSESAWPPPSPSALREA